MRPQPAPAHRQDLSHLTGTITKALRTDPAAPASVAITNEVNGKASVSSSASTTGVASNAGTDGNAPENGAIGQAPSEITKITVRVPADIVGRARTAWRVSLAHSDACPSFSAWVATAIEKAVIDAEARLTGGEPLEATGPGLIPTGGALHDRH